MQRGEYQSTICPYGYRKSANGRMEPDPEAAAVVQLIFQLAAEGKNAPSIARELYKRGIPTPAEYKITRGQKTHDVSRTHGIWCDSTNCRKAYWHMAKNGHVQRAISTEKLAQRGYKSILELYERALM